MTTFHSPFAYGDRVIIDDDESLFVRITQFLFRESHAVCEVSYVGDGEVKSTLVEVWRLSPAPEQCKNKPGYIQ